MPEFFHGWRRTMSAAMLLVALAVMSCWVLLDSDSNIVAFPLFDSRTHYLASNRGRFVWVAIQGNGQRPLPPILLKWATDDFHLDRSACYPFLFFDRRPFRWRGLWGGPEPVEPMIISITAMPYISIIIPLALLSAYLLLVQRKIKAKPRPDRQAVA